MSPGSWLWEAQRVVFYGVWGPLGWLDAWKCECLEDLGSGKPSVSYSTVSGGSWEVSAVAKVGSMGDAAWRKSTANYGVLAKVGSMGDAD